MHFLHLGRGGVCAVNRVVNRLVTLALMLLGTFSLIYLILDTLGCRVASYYPYGLLLLCLIVWLIAYAKKGIWIGLPLIGILIYILYRFHAEDLKNQFINFCDRITGVFAENILYSGQSYPYINSASDHSILFLILGGLIAGYSIMSLTSQGARINLALMGSVPFFVLCIIMNERPPVPTIIGMLLYWFLTAAGGYVYREDSSIGFAAIAAAAPFLLLLAGLLLLINPDSYEYKAPKYVSEVNFDNLLQKADQAVNDYLSKENVDIPEYITAPAPEQEENRELQKETEERPETQNNEQRKLVWQGENGILDLTQNARQEDMKQIFLKVSSSQSGALYLRGVSFGDYTGTGWLPAEKDTEVSSLAFTAQAAEAAGAEKQSVSVQMFSDTDFRFLPYFSMENGGLDSYVPSGDIDSYVSEYRSFPDSLEMLQLPEQEEQSEMTYREYAHTYYTWLPESTRNSLLSLCAEAGLSPDREDLIPAVAAYVQSQGIYDVNTEPYPSDDYAVYFLTVSHRGYCVHFATAAAALYRSLGIPARITEGFLAESYAGRITEVTGADAHAWVEVYQDGLGWLPVEVTGQSGLDSGIIGPEERVPEETAGSETPENETDPGTDESAAPTPEPTPQLPVGVITNPAARNEDELQSGIRRLFLWLVLPGVLALLLFIILIKRAVVLSIRQRKFMQPDTNSAAIAVYHAAQKAAVYGESVPEKIRITAERAAFSSHTIQKEEIETARQEYYSMIDRIYSRLKLLRKIQFKYFRAFK